MIKLLNYQMVGYLKPKWRISLLTNNLKASFENKSVLITGHTGFKGVGYRFGFKN